MKQDAPEPKLEDEPANFRSEDGKPFVLRCPACHMENWAPAVAWGQCAWCGWNAHNDCDTSDKRTSCNLETEEKE